MLALNGQRIILGSQSPRRKQLLERLALPFDIVVREIDEVFDNKLKREAIPAFLSEQKAKAFEGLLKSNEILITADTIVWQNDKAVGKPKNKIEAIETIKKLSGQTHWVYSAFHIKTIDKNITVTDAAEVHFSDITAKEISYYIEQYQPFDKAGSYGIQEWLGDAFIYKITGSYNTIMGLPTHLVYKTLKEFIKE